MVKIKSKTSSNVFGGVSQSIISFILTGLGVDCCWAIRLAKSSLVKVNVCSIPLERITRKQVFNGIGEGSHVLQL